MKRPIVEEIRIQVAVLYYPGKKNNDDDILDYVDDVLGFKAKIQQPYGAYMLDHGFIIFEGDRIPTLQEKALMCDSVEKSLKYLKK